jgi:HSP20 family molecular chaperone IbpA
MGDMDRLWDGGLFSQTTAQSNTNSSDLYRSEDGKTYQMRVAVPGFNRDQINIEVSKNHISVDAARADEEAPVVWQPLRLSLPDSLSYREQVPAHLDPSTAEAALKDGVLTITVSALTKEGKGSRITIK